MWGAGSRWYKDPMKQRILALAALALPVLALVACNEPKNPAHPASVALATVAPASVAAAASVAPASVAPATAASVAPKRGPNDIHWDGPVKWNDYAPGLAQATAEKKPILLLVYADWCPRCRELVPAFSDPEVAKLAEGMVLIKQNGDLKPEWLTAFDSLGGYVPRLFFLTPDGSLREEITSGHPRYPYFYTPGGLEALKAAMREALKG